MHGSQINNEKTQEIKNIFVQLEEGDKALSGNAQKILVNMIQGIIGTLEPNTHIDRNNIGITCTTHTRTDNNDNDITVELSPLAMACFYGWDNIIEMLLKSDELTFDINQPDEENKTALDRHYEYLQKNGISPSDTLINKLLLKNGAKSNKKGKAAVEDDSPGMDLDDSLQLSYVGVEPKSSRYNQLMFAKDGSSSSSDGKSEKVQEQRNFQAAMEIISDFVQEDFDEVKPPLPIRKYLAAQGGGAKGGVYTGALQAFSENGLYDDFEVVAGSSAGAITAFMIGLGLDAEQFKYVFDSINFLDFTQMKKGGYRDSLGPTLGKAADLVQYGSAFTGQSFHDWASFMCEQVLGDPNASFAELHEAAKTNPALKDVVCKATNLDGAVECTFSFEETPNARVADAIRASMAFPGAFQPWTIKNKDETVVGTFTDGGVLNNYPVDIFGADAYQDPHYPHYTKNDKYSKTHRISPAVVGLNLTGSVHKFDPSITPMTPEIKQLVYNRKGVQHLEGQLEVKGIEKPEEGSATWMFRSLFWGLWYNKMGRGQIEDMVAKPKLYGQHTIQIWTGDIKTLEFDVSKEKLANANIGTKNTTNLWLEKHCDPTQSYNGTFEADSIVDLKLKDKLPKRYYAEKLEECFYEFNLEMGRVYSREEKTGKQSTDDNIRLQYWSSRVDMLAEKYEEKYPDKDVKEILFETFNSAREKYKQRNRQLKETREKLSKIIKPEKLAMLITDKLADGKQTSRDEVLRILLGQMSNILPLIIQKDNNGQNLLATIIKTGDAVFVDAVLTQIAYTIEQCKDQSRYIKYDASTLLSDICYPFSFECALKDSDNPELINVLLKSGGEPFSVNRHDSKSAIQIAINLERVESFKAMLSYCKDNSINIGSQQIEGQSLGHYIVKYASEDFIKEISADEEMLAEIFDQYAIDNEGLTVVERAALRVNGEDSQNWLLMKKLMNDNSLDLNIIKTEAEGKVIVHNEILERAKERWGFLVNPELSNNTLEDSLLGEIVLLNDDSLEHWSGGKCHAMLTLKSKAIESKDAVLSKAIESKDAVLSKAIESKDSVLSKAIELAIDDSDTKLQSTEALISVIGQMAEEWDKDKVKQFLEQRTNDKTLVYYAAKSGNAELVRYLQENFQVDINNSGNLKRPCALTAAAKAGHSDVVEVMMSASDLAPRITRRQTDHYGKTALHYLAETGTAKAFCDVLFRGGGESKPENVLQQLDEDGRSPLSYLIEGNRTEVIQRISQEIKDKKLNFSFEDIFGWKSDVSDKLLQASCKASADLIFASKNNSELGQELYKELLNGIKDPDKRTKFKDFVEYYSEQRLKEIHNQINSALEEKYFDLAQNIIKQNLTSPQMCMDYLKASSGADSNINILARYPAMGETLVSLCEKVEVNHSAELKEVLEKKHKERTVLYTACENGNADIIKYIREASDVAMENVGPENCSSALLVAAKNRHDKAVIAVMDSYKGEGVLRRFNRMSRDASDESGNTALHYLAKHGSPEAFCRVLMGYENKKLSKLYLNKLNKDGQSPLTLLLNNNRLDTLEEIIKTSHMKILDMIPIADQDKFIEYLFVFWQKAESESETETYSIFVYIMSNLSSDEKITDAILEKLIDMNESKVLARKEESALNSSSSSVQPQSKISAEKKGKNAVQGEVEGSSIRPAFLLSKGSGSGSGSVPAPQVDLDQKKDGLDSERPKKDTRNRI